MAKIVTRSPGVTVPVNQTSAPFTVTGGNVSTTQLGGHYGFVRGCEPDRIDHRDDRTDDLQRAVESFNGDRADDNDRDRDIERPGACRRGHRGLDELQHVRAVPRE
jgi:hypothetical protein